MTMKLSKRTGWKHIFSRRHKWGDVGWIVSFAVDEDEGIKTPLLTISSGSGMYTRYIDIMGIRKIRSLNKDLADVLHEWRKETGDDA